MDGQAPIIQSPDQHIEYVVRDSQQSAVPIALEASTDADAQKLFWFANQQYIGESAPLSSSPTPLIWHATPGEYELYVSDNLGRSSTTKITVSSIN